MGQIGVSNSKGLIVYGKKADFHVLTEMAPVYVGHDKYYYLDGGFESWEDAGRNKVSAKAIGEDIVTTSVQAVIDGIRNNFV